MAKVCIYGVGAIGGFLAARLALAGQTVAGIARGAQLTAIRKNGLSLIEAGERRTVHIDVCEDPAEAGPQDVVFMAMKSHSAPAVAEAIGPLLGPHTIVVTAANGLPWWYFYQSHVDAHPPFLEHVDPGARLWQSIGPERAIGSVVYPAARVAEPGVIEHVFGDRFTLGEPDGSISERVEGLQAMLTEAGLDAATVTDIRAEIWAKLVANCAYNPVSIITDATLGDMLDAPDVYRLLERIMTEAADVAAAVNIDLPVTPKQLLELTRPLGAHKTSMLQDLQAGRSVELDTIVGAIRELGCHYRVATPAIDSVSALATQRARLAGCYPESSESHDSSRSE
jgi:2-dehydropantoate 2-reductase